LAARNRRTEASKEPQSAIPYLGRAAYFLSFHCSFYGVSYRLIFIEVLTVDLAFDQHRPSRWCSISADVKEQGHERSRRVELSARSWGYPTTDLCYREFGSHPVHSTPVHPHSSDINHDFWTGTRPSRRTNQRSQARGCPPPISGEERHDRRSKGPVTRTSTTP
jgi:hypothetical protein